jgi:hypothetical protein
LSLGRGRKLVQRKIVHNGLGLERASADTTWYSGSQDQRAAVHEADQRAELERYSKVVVSLLESLYLTAESGQSLMAAGNSARPSFGRTDNEMPVHKNAPDQGAAHFCLEEAALGPILVYRHRAIYKELVRPLVVVKRSLQPPSLAQGVAAALSRKVLEAMAALPRTHFGAAACWVGLGWGGGGVAAAG